MKTLPMRRLGLIAFHTLVFCAISTSVLGETTTTRAFQKDGETQTVTIIGARIVKVDASTIISYTGKAEPRGEGGGGADSGTN